jgi:FdhD protein
MMIFREMGIGMTVNDKSSGIWEVTELTMTVVEATHETHSETEMYVCEHMIDVYVNERKAASLVCTPSNLEYLVLGRLLTEGIISGVSDVETLYICDNGNTAKVFVNNSPRLKVSEAAEPTCCTGNRLLLQNIKDDWMKPVAYVPVSCENVFTLTREFAAGSKIHGKTKGTHSCYLQCGGETVFQCEDIGRHNALDKCIGYMVKNSLNPLECMLFTTGRIPTDMVKKAVAAGVGCLVSKAVPTDAAVEMAKMYNLNLICRAWPDSYTVANTAK